MSNNLKKNVWVIGVGPMAIDYFRVINSLDYKSKFVGRGDLSSKIFFEQTKVNPHKGGLDLFLEKFPEKCSHAIVAVGVENLTDCTIKLINYGIKHILVEKPAGLTLNQITKIRAVSNKKKASVYIAYNRRFYKSVNKAKKLIADDGGLSSFHFEFTEFGHKIKKLSKLNKIKEHLLLCNSSHVIDLAFFLGGKPDSFNSFQSDSLSWHPSAAVFTGCGITTSAALFSYHANWKSPGRWGIELNTKNLRLKLQPLEQLFLQNKNSFDWKAIKLNDSKDKDFKPGLYRMVSDFLDYRFEYFPNISDQCQLIDICYKIANY